MALGFSQAFPVRNSPPHNGTQPSSQDEIKGVPFSPRPIVSDGLEIAIIKPRELPGRGLGRAQREKYSQSCQAHRVCPDKTSG